MARSLSGDEGSEVAAREDAKLGVVDALALLGPFRDTGGGLDAHDGPEATGERVRRRHSALLVGLLRGCLARRAAVLHGRGRGAPRRVRLPPQGELHMGRRPS